MAFATAKGKVQALEAKMRDKMLEEKERRAAFDERLKRLQTQLKKLKARKLQKLRRRLKSATNSLKNYSTPSLSTTL